MSHTADDAKNTTTAADDELSEERFLEAYKKKEYPKPSLTADIAVFRRSENGIDVLMIRRGKHPYQGFWALPGGFANPDEDVIDAARRELEEETGVAGLPIELFGIYGAPGRDPRGWTVSGGFCTLMDGDIGIEAGDDAADARWCAVSEATCEQSPAQNGERAIGASDGARTLSVRCSGDADEEALFVHFELVPQNFGAPRAHVIDSHGFAFDHAQLLADAYLKVTQLMRKTSQPISQSL